MGNFSVVPRARLQSLVAVPELWNHYDAAVFSSRQPYGMVPTHRAKRYHGHSKMNLVSLVTHGLSALSVLSAQVGVRLLILTMPVLAATVIGMRVTVYLRTIADLVIPGWSTAAFGIPTILLSQGLVFALLSCFMVLGSRSGMPFLPSRDYHFFILRVEPRCGDPCRTTPM